MSTFFLNSVHDKRIMTISIQMDDDKININRSIPIVTIHSRKRAWCSYSRIGAYNIIHEDILGFNYITCYTGCSRQGTKYVVWTHMCLI